MPPESDLDFCGDCLKRAPNFHKTHTIYTFEGVAAELIKIFKYHHQLCIGTYFAEKIAARYYQIGIKYDCLIPMPLNKKRLKERGYNQVIELLRVLKKDPKITIDTKSIIRQKSTQPLNQLTQVERKREIKNAFKVAPLPYQKILLIDDILTTGTSLNELAKTILKSSPQVKSCDVLTLSRA